MFLKSYHWLSRVAVVLFLLYTLMEEILTRQTSKNTGPAVAYLRFKFEHCFLYLFMGCIFRSSQANHYRLELYMGAL